MSIQRAEELKQEWTDRQVVIRSGIPELRRFDGLVGQVRTVNMNCRLLIEFAAPADISWYDIDPQFVTIVESAQSQPSPAESVGGTNPGQSSAPTAVVNDAAQEQVSVTASAAKPPAGSSTGTSPLDRIRQQHAGADSCAPQPAGSATEPTAESPLDQIRKSGAFKASNDTDKADAAPANDSTTPDSGDQEIVGSSPNAGGSPLDLIRRQAAATAATVSEGDDVVQAEDVPEPSSITDDASAAATPVTGDAADEVSTSTTQAATDAVASSTTTGPVSNNPFDQVRAQAAADSDASGTAEPVATQTIFDQVRAQAAED
ncbi:MAG: hypothetical protein ABGZ53_02205 [Fuerstiella sp.]